MVHGAIAIGVADDRRGGRASRARSRRARSRIFSSHHVRRRRSRNLPVSRISVRIVFARAGHLRLRGTRIMGIASLSDARRRASKPRTRRSARPIRREMRDEDAARAALDSVLPPSVTKIRSSTPLDCNSIRLSVATFIESNAFRRHRGFDQMKARRKRAKAASSKGAAKKAPKKKKARRKKAKKK
jgi:hypothetical protein